MGAPSQEDGATEELNNTECEQCRLPAEEPVQLPWKVCDACQAKVLEIEREEEELVDQNVLEALTLCTEMVSPTVHAELETSTVEPEIEIQLQPLERGSKDGRAEEPA